MIVLFLLNALLRLINLFTLVLAIYALLSWFPGAYQSRLGRMIVELVEPILTPFRRLNLVFMGLDFTVYATILALRFLSRALIVLFSFLL